MPPARKRTRTYDPARTRTAVLAQLGNVRAAVGVLTPEQLALPTRLGEWTVGELVTHVGMALESVDRLLGVPEPGRQDATVLDWPPAASADLTHAFGQRTGPGAFLADVERSLTQRLAEQPVTRLLDTNAGAMPLTDYLVTRTVELVAHTDDLNAAVPGLGITYDRQALAAATRLLADALAAKAPGASTEVRVPPFAVVQCVEGPRHTRGTPPNVVETDPLTWVRLATGRVEWSAALADAKVTASGERADLGGLLPLMA